jgi:hypothetical protein
MGVLLMLTTLRCADTVTRAEEELGNELTGGWKVIEVSFLFLPACCFTERIVCNLI